MRRYVSALLGLTLLGAPEAVASQDTTWNRYTLEGLQGVFVRAEADPACEAAGVAAADVQSTAALQLIEADVSLLTREEMLALVGLPELRVTVQCSEGTNGASGALAYTVGLRVQQAVKLIRNEQITLAEAVTWYSTAVGTADPSGAKDTVFATLASELEAFATAFAEANAETEGTR